MMVQRRLSWLVVPALALVAGLAGCSKQGASETPRIEDKVFSLNPMTAPVRVAFLTGELTDLKVVQRVNAQTGEVVDPPKLRGTLKLKNGSSDQAVRLLTGDIEYLDGAGKLIALAKERSDTSFKFYSYQAERLDPGMATSHDIDVPFPAVAVNGKTLADVRLNVTYIPEPYREESVTVPMVMAK